MLFAMRKLQALLLFLAITAVFCSAQICEKKLRLVFLHANGSQRYDEAQVLQALINNKNISGTVKTNVNGQLGQFISVSYIVEDVEPRIASVKFQGVQQLDSALLEDAAHSLLQTAYNQSAVLTFCNSNLKNLYLARGYLKVHFADLVYKLANESVQEPLVEVTIPVDEGRQYHFAGGTWTGNTSP